MTDPAKDPDGLRGAQAAREVLEALFNRNPEEASRVYVALLEENNRYAITGFVAYLVPFVGAMANLLVDTLGPQARDQAVLTFLDPDLDVGSE